MSFKKFKNKFLFTNYPDFGLLVLRLGLGITMLMGHGVDKLANFSAQAGRFPDPIGLGSGFSLFLATFSEFVCSIAIICGIFTRPATLFLMITMAVAFFIVHSGHPFPKKELALIYLIGFSALFCTGAGRISVDHKL